MEIWCVEVESVSPSELDPGVTAMIWFVTRVDSQSEWGAAPLMAMSSTWPYEACGVFP